MEVSSLRIRTIRRAAFQLAMGICASAVIILSTFADDSLPAPPPPSFDALPTDALPQDQVEVLTRGPVHEAFAEPLVVDLGPSLVVPKRPPEVIVEVPPDFKPEGDDVVWISGYWAWDDDRDTFLWVSGTWRKLPPNQRWIPGYWLQVDGGWQWVSGMWLAEQQEELQYREPPPQSLEVGPSVAAPSDAYFWVPGCWVWYDSGHRWRPGYWHPYQENWVWVPAHWMWTPSGCIYVAGYWDHRVSTRGQLFAPVYFRNTVWPNSYYYSPTCVVESTPLMIHFWVRPNYGHYYFGDYYGAGYASRGLSPWCQWNSRPGHCDPLLTHYQVHYQHQNHFDYTNRMQKWHSYYDKHDDLRPRRTFQDQQNFADHHHGKGSDAATQSLLGMSLASAAQKNGNPIALKPLSNENKKHHFDESKHFRDLTRERSNGEKFAKFDGARRVDGDSKIDLKKGRPDEDQTKPAGVGSLNNGNAGKNAAVDLTKNSEGTLEGKRGKGDDDKGGDDKHSQKHGTLKLPKASNSVARKSDGPKPPSLIDVPSAIEQKNLSPEVRSKIGNAGGQQTNDVKLRGLEKFDRDTGNSKNANSKDDDKQRNKSSRSKNDDDDDVHKAKSKTIEQKSTPRVEQRKVEPPKFDLPKTEKPKNDSPKIEKPKTEKPKSEPKVEAPKRNDPPKKQDDDKKPKRDRK